MKLQLEVYQWLGPIIAGYFIVRTYRQYREGKYSPRNTIIWITFWSGVLLLALLPDRVPNMIARGLGFKDHINAIIFAALALLFLMVFYLSAAVNRIEDKLTSLVRKIALDPISSTSTLMSNSDNSNSDNSNSDNSNSDNSRKNRSKKKRNSRTRSKSKRLTKS